MDAEEYLYLVSIGCINALESHVRQEIDGEFPEWLPGIHERALGYLADAIQAISNCLQPINLDLAKCVLKVVGGLIVAPRIPVAIKNPNSLETSDIGAG